MLEKVFNKYIDRGSIHWHEMMSRDPRRFNGFQQARYEWILKVAGTAAGKKVLDVGCGDGALSYILAKAGASVTGVDNEPRGIEFAWQNLNSQNRQGKLQYEFAVASAYELPFPDDSFDLVVSCEVIEHVADPQKMIAEMKRVSKPRGMVILTTPYRHREVPADPNHVTEYFPESFRKLMALHFPNTQIKLTHHMLWTAISTYSFRNFANRQFGYWLLNALTLWFKFNPFMIDYDKPTKRDLFSEILAFATKE